MARHIGGPDEPEPQHDETEDVGWDDEDGQPHPQ